MIVGNKLNDKRDEGRKFGTVIVFSSHLPRHKAEEVLKKLEKDGIIEYHCGVNSFNPDHGSPVWYIP